MSNPRKLVLYANATHGKFTLRFEESTDSFSFASAPEAIEFAVTIVKDETALSVFDEDGREIIRTTVLPQCDR